MNTFPIKTLTWVAGDVRRIVFDLQAAPEVVAGEALTAPTVAPVAGLTFGAAAVLAVETDKIPAGKGVAVLVTTAIAGTFIVTLSVVAGGTQTLTVPVRLIVASPPSS